MRGERRGDKKKEAFNYLENLGKVNFVQPALHIRGNEEHLVEATEGVSSATLATLLIITLALGWKYNSLATRSINTTQVFVFLFF